MCSCEFRRGGRRSSRSRLHPATATGIGLSWIGGLRVTPQSAFVETEWRKESKNLVARNVGCITYCLNYCYEQSYQYRFDVSYSLWYCGVVLRFTCGFPMDVISINK